MIVGKSSVSASRRCLEARLGGRPRRRNPCQRVREGPTPDVPRQRPEAARTGVAGPYAVGLAASLTHHAVLAVVLFASGITVSALAAWLSRGNDSGGGPPRGDQPVDEQPPPDPAGMPRFDWVAFERDFEDYARGRRNPVGAP